jgi:hypothetical protein
MAYEDIIELGSKELRQPTNKLEISWKNVLSSGEWFRLDQSTLDSGAILTRESYEEEENITEIITDVNAKVYSDESEYVMMLEGFSELIGDNYQYAISDFDCELDNTTNRFTPRENKNKLENPSFEFNKNDWNEEIGGAAAVSITENVSRTPIRSMYIENPSADDVYVFSNVIKLNEDNPISGDEDWSYSFYINGSGNANINLYAFGQTNSGVNDISTGYLSGSSYQTELVSGEWTRFKTNLSVPSGAYYLRAMFALSGEWSYFDDGQVEESIDVTAYDDEFVGDLILPKRPIKVEVGFSDNNVNKFSGAIEKIDPKLKEDSVHIYSYDWATLLKDFKIEEIYYENLRTDEIITRLAGLAGVDSSKIDLETGNLTIEFAWFPEGTIWYYMTQVAEAEGGAIFFDTEGILKFWNKDHFKETDESIYDFTFDTNILDLDYEVSKNRVRNRIEVRANPKKKLESKTIYSVQDDPTSISAGSTQEVWAQYFYGLERSVPALNVEVPVIGTDIIGNSQSDGGGTDLSAYLSISSYSIFRESIRINIANSHPTDTIYITTINITGDPIVTKSRVESTEEDQPSQSIYGVQILSIENDLIDDQDYADTLAEQRLAELKDPLDFIRIEAVGVPFLEPGDKVNVERSFDGTKEDFYIVSNRWRQDDDFIQTLELQKKVIIN